MARIELSHVTKRWGGFYAVDDLDLVIEDNAFVTLLGPSGCGKTTTLRMIAGLETPTTGRITIDDVVVFDSDAGINVPANKRRVGFLFQNYALWPNMTVYQNIAFGLGNIKEPGLSVTDDGEIVRNPDAGGQARKLTKEEINRIVARVSAIVKIQPFMDRYPGELSGGQQQRVAIARALVNEPEILLLDEPLGALDLKMRKEMQIELKAMHDELGITFIYVTHDQEEALTMSDKIVVMSEGKIQQIGTPEDIYNEPQNAFVADFIGESNIFNGIMTGSMKARFAGGQFTCVDDVPEGTQITAVVRPEDIELTAPSEGQIRGKVISVIFKGMHYEITVQSGRYEVVIQSTKSAEVGSEVGMKVEPDGIHIMIAENHTNVFPVDMNRNHRLEFNGQELDTSLTQLIRGSRRNENHELLDENGEVIDPEKIHIVAAIEPQDIRMTDDVDDEAVLIEGTISNLIYKGDHYSYVINTELGQDFIVDDEYLWNMGDRIGLILPLDKMRFTVKK